MRTIAGIIDPGVAMEHEFILPDALLEFMPTKLKQPNGTYTRGRMAIGVRKDFLDWCENNLSGFVVFSDCGFRIRVCHEDYVLIKLKYFVKETTWQRIT